MTEHVESSSSEIDVLFVGKTGAGKSSLINMIMDLPDNVEGAAKVNNDVIPCTQGTTLYPMPPGSDLRCRLWDTRGLDEAVDHGWFRTKIVDRIFQATPQQVRELKETLRDRTRESTPILVWCIDAAKIEVAAHWEQFRRVYVEYCGKKAVPVVVVTQMHPKENGWEKKCNDQLAKLDFGGPSTVSDRLLRVRKYQRATKSEEPSTVYKEDSKALKALISDIQSGNK